MISIIALLIGILLPALGAARVVAAGSTSLSNIRQIGIGMAVYSIDHKQMYPKHSSPSSTSPRTCWPDYIFPYMQDVRVYRSPLLTASQRQAGFTKPFAHDPTETYGGYGYNFQYLGNARFSPSLHARADIDIINASQTVCVGDTAGSRNANASNQPGDGASAVYVLDPPLGSACGAHPTWRPYYELGAEELAGNGDTYVTRAFPAERNSGAANMGLCDGHVAAMTMQDIDDYDANGVKDNGYWNGRGDPTSN